jgi:hypothetical protein
MCLRICRHGFVAVVLVCISLALAAQSGPTAGSGQFDGPAELPRLYVKTSLADTPAPGKRWMVKRDQNVQQALDRAQCGDTIELQAGAVFTGPFRLPHKACDDRHWIIVRTSAADSELPPPGTRLTPCYAGVSELPGRPPLRCATVKNVLAKLVGTPPLRAPSPVDHYRILGLELTQPPGSRSPALAEFAVNSDHIIVDRCWIHGNALDNTHRGVALNGSYLAVIDSTITDVKMVNTDTQGIAAWTGTGPLKIVDNFVEGGSSAIGFGGAGSETTPSDIEIRRNHLFKPLSWRIGDPNFLGVIFNNKVALESKNSSRVLVEGNILENVWGGRQGGDGNAVWLGPKNQNNACPTCQVDDITFRYNLIRRTGGGVYIFDSLSDAGGAAQRAMRYSIHDNLLEDISTDYAGTGNANGILFRLHGTIDFLPPRDITIEHNTAFTDGQRSGALSLLGAPNATFERFVFRDNLISGGRYPITGCKGRSGSEVLETCAPGYVFVDNVMVGGDEFYPKSNAKLAKDKKIKLYPSDWRAVRFVRWETDAGSNDYRLCRGAGNPAAGCTAASPYINAASDGRDIGADIGTLQTMLEGVE